VQAEQQLLPGLALMAVTQLWVQSLQLVVAQVLEEVHIFQVALVVQVAVQTHQEPHVRLPMAEHRLRAAMPIG
jgi:hypothetical protein